MKIAFAIPLDATRHMKYASNLMTLVSPLSDVYVILTTQRDLAIWNRSIINSSIKTIVLSDWVSEAAIYLAIRNKSMPTFKKWLALEHILEENSYSYIICCDCEVEGIKPIDEEFIAALPSQFNFVGDHLAGKYVVWNKIIDASNTWPLSTQHEHRSDCDLKIHTWWSGLPVYAVESLREFLEYVGVDNHLKLAKSLRWELFDHLVYQQYLLNNNLDGAKLICLTHDLETPNGWSLEAHFSSPAVYEASRKAGLQTLWATKAVFKSIPEAVSGIYIVYHLDR